MEITITKKYNRELKEWISYYSDENKDATHTGIFLGIKHTLTKFGIYSELMYNEPIEIKFELDETTLNELISKMKKNMISAMLNLGLASGISWILEDLGLYTQSK